MKCLIIAAGRGRRLTSKYGLKPLIPLLGLHLIERVILTAYRAGLSEFYVVTGYNGEKIKDTLNKFKKERNISITYITNEEWGKENGLSVLKARKLLSENFILLMGDHIFEESILKSLLTQEVSNGEVVLAVDYNVKTNKFIDLNDVTKVFVKKDKILNIGKRIMEYNGYDTGIFLCSPAIFNAIEESLSKGNSSLSGGIKVLAQKNKVRAFNINGWFWIDVDDENRLKKAEKWLLSNLKKSSDGPISRYLNRPISIRITKHLLKTRISPNLVSFISFIIATFGAVFFFLGGYANLVVGGILAQLSSIIDGCDGEIARLKFQTTEFGGWFDAVLDRYADAFLLFGLTSNVYFLRPSFLNILIGFLAIIGTFMNSYTADKYDGLMKKKLNSKHYFRIRIGRDVRIFIIFVGALINQPLLTLLVIAVLMNIENVRRVILLYKYKSG
jgi:CDP-L-myo-inositol myo-inositolphosphotransferase